MHWTPLGDSAVLLTLPARVDAVAVARRIEKARPAGFIECVPAFESVAVCFDPMRATVAELTTELATVLARAVRKRMPAPKPREVVIPVCYGGEYGPDLPDVAAQCGLGIDSVIKLHASGHYVVRALGFMPGFPYLSGLDTRLRTPRRATPRTRIPAGSVGIGGAQTGVYPLASPGGWNLIGRTPLALFNATLPDAPTLLRPGDRVRFKPIKAEEFAK